MRVIVTGSRDWGRGEIVFGALGGLWNMCQMMDTTLTIVHGGCPSGADRFAHDFALGKAGVREEVFRADWNRHGKMAGPIRNAEMADSGADLVMAFWDGTSRGTENMIRRARERNIPTIVRFS